MFCGWNGIEAPGSMLSQIAFTSVKSSMKAVMFDPPAEVFVMSNGVPNVLPSIRKPRPTSAPPPVISLSSIVSASCATPLALI